MESRSVAKCLFYTRYLPWVEFSVSNWFNILKIKSFYFSFWGFGLRPKSTPTRRTMNLQKGFINTMLLLLYELLHNLDLGRKRLSIWIRHQKKSWLKTFVYFCKCPELEGLSWFIFICLAGALTSCSLWLLSTGCYPNNSTLNHSSFGNIFSLCRCSVVYFSGNKYNMN